MSDLDIETQRARYAFWEKCFFQRLDVPEITGQLPTSRAARDADLALVEWDQRWVAKDRREIAGGGRG